MRRAVAKAARVLLARGEPLRNEHGRIRTSDPQSAVALAMADWQAAAAMRTHLKRLFAKTGTRRQAELVTLVGGLSLPLVSSPGSSA